MIKYIKHKIIETEKGKLLVIGGLPEDAHWIEPNEGSHSNEFVYESNDDDSLTFLIPAGFWKLLGKLSEVKEEDAEKVVEDCPYYAKCWKKYNIENELDYGDCPEGDFDKGYSCWTAKESLQSLVEANVTLRNKYDSDLRPADQCGPSEYLEEEDKVFHNPILFFEYLNK